MQRILRIINRFNIGGPTYNVAYLSKFLADNYETLLIGGEPDEGEVDSLHVLTDLGLKPRIIPELKRKPNIKEDIRAFLAIRRIIKEFKPDIVHTHAAKAGAIGRLAAISCRVPIVVHTFHGHVFKGYFSPVKTKIYILIERWLAKHSTGIVAISNEQKKDLVEVYKIVKPDKVRIVPLGFDLDQFQKNKEINRKIIREKYELHEDQIALAIVGRLAPIKNHSMFFEALRIVQANTSAKIKVFIVGDGLEREKLEAISRTIPQNHRFSIIFTSWIKEIALFNPGMDIFCLTSLNEGTPVSLIEAQAANIPVLSTDVGGVCDVVIANETGFLVPSGDTKEFAKKLLVLIENKNIREKMSQNSGTYVEENYDYRILVSNMKRYYEDLHKKKHEN
jgi:glycosyltransferase involved in cell wall biosynthesis